MLSLFASAVFWTCLTVGLPAASGHSSATLESETAFLLRNRWRRMKTRDF